MPWPRSTRDSPTQTEEAEQLGEMGAWNMDPFRMLELHEPSGYSHREKTLKNRESSTT